MQAEIIHTMKPGIAYLCREISEYIKRPNDARAVQAQLREMHLAGVVEVVQTLGRPVTGGAWRLTEFGEQVRATTPRPAGLPKPLTGTPRRSDLSRVGGA